MGHHLASNICILYLGLVLSKHVSETYSTRAERMITHSVCVGCVCVQFEFILVSVHVGVDQSMYVPLCYTTSKHIIFLQLCMLVVVSDPVFVTALRGYVVQPIISLQTKILYRGIPKLPARNVSVSGMLKIHFPPGGEFQTSQMSLHFYEARKEGQTSTYGRDALCIY